MKWREVEQDWDEVKGEFRRYWSKLSEDDLREIDGERRELVEALLDYYGWTPSETKHHVDRFVRRLEAPQKRGA